MTDLLIYLACTIAGYFVGTALKKRGKALNWTGKAQTAVIMVIILAMGARMGANEEVVAHLGEIGLSAVVLTVLSLIFTVAALFITRRAMGIDRYGRMTAGKDPAAENTGEQESGGGINTMTLLILAAVTVGAVLGRLLPFVSRWDAGLSTLINVGLCLLLFSIGLDLGREESGGQNIKAVGARVFVFPVVTAAATLLAGVLGGIVLKLNVVQSVAIVSGFSWYTLAPGLIMEAGYLEAGAIALLSNILREVLSFIFVPMVARRIGYIETIGMPGAAAMDVCLPIVERSTSAEVAVYSLVSGMVLSLSVPFLVPLILTLA